MSTENKKKILHGTNGVPWTDQQYEKVKKHMQERDDDAQRLLIIDWLATSYGAARAKPHVPNMGPYLFIDDSRFATSSQSASVSVIQEQITVQ